MDSTRGVWTSPIIGLIIQDEFQVSYHQGHVRKILNRAGFFRAASHHRLNAGRFQKTKQMDSL